MDKKTTQNVVGMLEQWFAKAPALPKNVTEVIVKITPILSLVFGILGILFALGGLGVLTVFSPLAFFFGGPGGMSAYGTGFLAALIWLASSVLMLLSYTGLKAKKANGWNMLFWSEVVSLVGSVLSVSGLLSGVIGALIAFYLLFQIKPYFK